MAKRFALFTLVTMLAIPWSAQAQTVTVTDKDDIYTVEGSVNAKGSVLGAWDVLTDYQHFNLLAPIMTDNQIIKGPDGLTTFHQKYQVGPPGFRRNIEMLIEAHEEPFNNRIVFHDKLLKDFRVMDGQCSVLGTADTTAVHVTVHIRLVLSAPHFVVRHYLSSKMKDFLAKFREHIEHPVEDLTSTTKSP